MSNPTRKKISLALQGGGALGAFTWGVLDKFLEDDSLEIAAVSGASAGAMNAVVMAQGFCEGGSAGARAKLRAFWEAIASASQNPYRRMPMVAFMNAFTPSWMQQGAAAWAMWTDMASRVASPYELNPLNINPLRDVLEELVDFAHVRTSPIKLFISATNVETGRIRVFSNGDLASDHIMASACLPHLFQAVEIDGAPYWDGGYMGNPALFPLFGVQDTCDIVIVQINPIHREGAPRSAPEIIARVNEITFNASLLSELRAIEFVGRLLDESRLPEGRYRKMLIHVVNHAKALRPLGVGADLNTDLSVFEDLFKTGRRTASRWLKTHGAALGERSTVDLRAMFKGESSVHNLPLEEADTEDDADA